MADEFVVCSRAIATAGLLRHQQHGGRYALTPSLSWVTARSGPPNHGRPPSRLSISTAGKCWR